MDSYIGKCEYCGNEMAIIAENQKEANDTVSKECSCGGNRKAEKKQALKDRLRELLGPGCEELNFRPVEDPVYQVIEDIGCMVIEGKIQHVTLKVDGTVVVIKGGEKTKVIRKFTYEQAGEVE